MGLVDEGDEVLFFDPSYDCYRAQVQMAGGKSVGLPLKPRQPVIVILNLRTAKKMLKTVVKMDTWQDQKTNGILITKPSKNCLMKKPRCSF